MNSITSIERPTSAPPPANSGSGHFGQVTMTFTPDASSSSQTFSAQQSRPKGMQLGIHKATSQIPGSLISEIEDNDGANAWGNGDLMDVNADEGDWGAFASGSDVLLQNGEATSSKSVGAPSVLVQGWHNYFWYYNQYLPRLSSRCR